MRVAVQNPSFLRGEQTRNFDGYNFEFVRQFKPLIYLPSWQSKLTAARFWQRDIRKSGLDPAEFEFVFSVRELNRKADVLVCFNQGACLPRNRPPAVFRGFKVWHVMDFNFRVGESYEALRSGGVHLLLAYAALDRHCTYFRHFYPDYIGKVLAVPFGFGSRFTYRTPWTERCQKVIAMGAINPLDARRLPDPGIIREYLEFYREFGYSQMWRHTLSEHESELADVLVSYLPKPPRISRPSDDPVELLNRHAMYANDESICGFPPARTYEGAACGAAMVSSDHKCFRDLGFEDGRNCIMHQPLDIESFREKVGHYLARRGELEAIAQRGCEMVRSRYTHEQVARRLHADILARCAA